MPIELPDDVWLEIVKNHVLDKPDGPTQSRGRSARVHHLSLTCKRLRRILLCYVYHTLTFTLFRQPEYSIFDDWYPSHNAVPNEVLMVEEYAPHQSIRASALQQHPHLLQHVQELRLMNWSAAMRAVLNDPCDQRNQPSESFFARLQAAEIQLSYTIDLINTLVSNMHELRRVELRDSFVTDELHYSIFSHRTMETLVLSTAHEEPDVVWYTPVGPPPAIHLRHLRLVDKDNSPANDYFAHILEHCIFDLISLAISVGKLPYVLPIVAGKRLPLRTFILARDSDDGPRKISPEAWDMLRRIFPSFAELRRLELDEEDVWPVSPPPIDSDILPILESIGSPLYFIHAFVPGRPVRRIDLTGRTESRINTSHSPTFVSASLGLPSSSTAQIQHLTMHHLVCRSDEDLFTVLGHLSELTNLNTLSVAIDAEDWEVPTAMKEFCLSAAEALDRLSALRICNVRKLDKESLPFVSVCPIAQMHDPDDRGHPSLERLVFLSPDEWRWIPGKGWTS